MLITSRRCPPQDQLFWADLRGIGGHRQITDRHSHPIPRIRDDLGHRIADEWYLRTWLEAHKVDHRLQRLSLKVILFCRQVTPPPRTSLSDCLSLPTSVQSIRPTIEGGYASEKCCERGLGEHKLRTGQMHAQSCPPVGASLNDRLGGDRARAALNLAVMPSEIRRLWD